MSVLFYLSIILFFFPKEKDWISYSKSPKFTSYYDKNSITKNSNGNFTVWCKEVPTADSIARFRKQLYDISNNPAYFDFAFTLQKEEVSCTQRKVRIQEMIDYGNNKSIIQKASIENEADWQIPPKGTEGFILIYAVCDLQ